MSAFDPNAFDTNAFSVNAFSIAGVSIQLIRPPMLAVMCPVNGEASYKTCVLTGQTFEQPLLRVSIHGTRINRGQ